MCKGDEKWGNVEAEQDLRDAYYLSTKGGAPCMSIAKRAQIFSLSIINVWDEISVPSSSNLEPPESSFQCSLWEEESSFHSHSQDSGH